MGSSITRVSKIEISDKGPVRVISLNRPEVHNCIDGETAEALAEAIMAFEDQDDARVLIIAGSGEHSFCTGADLKAVGSLRGHKHFEASGPLGFARLDPRKPAIAAIDGYCLAGGLELAAWCDFRVASENSTFGGLNRRWGISFIDGGTQRIPRITGMGHGLYLLLTGVQISAERAFELGLVQEVVAPGKALERAIELANQMASYPQASLVADRTAALSGSGMDLDEGLLLERRLGGATLDDEESRAALEGFAKGERPPPPRPLDDR